MNIILVRNENETSLGWLVVKIILMVITILQPLHAYSFEIDYNKINEIREERRRNKIK